jgi:hypothetical protein
MLWKNVLLKAALISMLCLVWANFSSVLGKTKASSHDKSRIQNVSHDDPAKSFCVVTSIFNPVPFESRYKSYMLFEQHILSFGVYLITVELVVNNRTFQVTDANNPRHIQLRTPDVLWYKENLINIGIKRSPAHCKYIAWIDLEVRFLNMNWVRDTMNALEQFKVVQLFEVVKILGPESQTIEAHIGFGQCHTKNRVGIYAGKLKKKYNVSHKHYCAPGYAWGAKKTTLLEIGGLFDKGIVGDGDSMMSAGFKGSVSKSKSSYGPYLLEAIVEWQKKTKSIVKRGLGYVEGAVNHLWHGSRKTRGYVNRRRIIKSSKIVFDPKEHIYYDENGLIRFQPNVGKYYSKLILKYLRSRNEDS